MESEYVTLGICQAEAKKGCIKKSEAAFREIQAIFFRVFRIFNDAMQRIWNNHELMTQKTECGVLLIIAGSGEEGVREREIFESILSVFSFSLLPVKQLIFEGSYVSACTLLRSNIETMVQLRKILDGRYKSGETPRVSGEDERIRKMYGEITGLAHLSDDVFLSKVTKGRSANSSYEILTPLFRMLSPQFNSALGANLFALHIICSIEIIFRVNSYLEKNIPDRSISEKDLNDLRECSEFVWLRFA